MEGISTAVLHAGPLILLRFRMGATTPVGGAACPYKTQFFLVTPPVPLLS